MAGIPTAFTGDMGAGKPVIALGRDIDDIPQASQKPGVALSRADDRGRAGPRRRPQLGHAAEHPGGDRGEEGDGAGDASGNDQAMAGRRGGATRDEGILRPRGGFQECGRRCLFAHVADNFGVSWGPAQSQTGMVSVEYIFKGESAHAAGAPWRGKSALDAVELMDVGWNFRREHLRLTRGRTT